MRTVIMRVWKFSNHEVYTLRIQMQYSNTIQRATWEHSLHEYSTYKLKIYRQSVETESCRRQQWWHASHLIMHSARINDIQLIVHSIDWPHTGHMHELIMHRCHAVLQGWTCSEVSSPFMNAMQSCSCACRLAVDKVASMAAWWPSSITGTWLVSMMDCTYVVSLFSSTEWHTPSCTGGACQPEAHTVLLYSYPHACAPPWTQL